MLNAIIGLKINIQDTQCQYKLSQNKSQIDQQQVIEQLEKQGSSELVQAMKQCNK
jgi:transcriptional regulator